MGELDAIVTTVVVLTAIVRVAPYVAVGLIALVLYRFGKAWFS